MENFHFLICTLKTCRSQKLPVDPEKTGWIRGMDLTGLIFHFPPVGRKGIHPRKNNIDTQNDGLEKVTPF